MRIVLVEFVSGGDSKGVDDPGKVVWRDCKNIWMVSCLDFILYEMKIHKGSIAKLHDYNYTFES